jgi:membrane protease YdiL (CAAX protease family)
MLTGTAGPQPLIAAKSAETELRFKTDLDELKRVGWLVGLLLAITFVLSLVARRDSSPWVDVGGAIVSASIILCFAFLWSSDVVPLLGVRRPSAKDISVFLAVAVGLCAFLWAYMTLVGRLGVPFINVSEQINKAGWPFWSAVLVFGAAPAIFEELAFRGLIQGALTRVMGPREGWLIQGALFSVLHLLPLIFLSHFVMGLSFGYLRRRFGSLYPGMLLHGTWNTFVLLQEWHHI